jgi:diaminohydroxyphosphoribosylaminopyrimidine deaminase / 5-amino-6-(5-phosphoribosylamino)uracil reductase
MREPETKSQESDYMRQALGLARRGYGSTSPNPMVGAILVKNGTIIGRGWHHRAGEPHAEIEALRDAQKRGFSAKGATLYVTLEPCCTQGRTPPCTEAILSAGVRKVVVGATDPNPRHCGRGFGILKRAGVAVIHGVLREECERLNEAFNHWIVHHTPFVTVKAGMTLDGKIATASGESRWITGGEARAYGMKLRQGADAILVGINTILADDPSLTFRKVQRPSSSAAAAMEDEKSKVQSHQLRRIVLDALARTPLSAKVISDEHAALSTVVVSEQAPKGRIAALSRRAKIRVAPLEGRGARDEGRGARRPALDLPWLLKTLGAQDVTHLLVEGGGEVNASFLLQRLAQRIAFFYAPKILGGRDSRTAVAGLGAASRDDTLDLRDLEWRRLGPDWLLTARVQ